MEELRVEGYIQEAVTQVLAWATSDEGKRFRKKIWDKLKTKWLTFTGSRPYTELIDDVQQETADILDDLMSVYRYDKNTLGINIGGIKTDPYNSYALSIKGDVLTFYGNLRINGNIEFGDFNITTGLFLKENDIFSYMVLKGLDDDSGLVLDGQSKLLKIGVPASSGLKVSSTGISIDLKTNGGLSIAEVASMP